MAISQITSFENIYSRLNAKAEKVGQPHTQALLAMIIALPSSVAACAGFSMLFGLVKALKYGIPASAIVLGSLAKIERVTLNNFNDAMREDTNDAVKIFMQSIYDHSTNQAGIKQEIGRALTLHQCDDIPLNPLIIESLKNESVEVLKQVRTYRMTRNTGETLDLTLPDHQVRVNRPNITAKISALLYLLD